MSEARADIGMIGLGVMGRNLLLNLADHGFIVAGYDRDPQKVAALRREGASGQVQGAEDLATFLALLRTPRALLLLVPAGKAVDAVLDELLPHLQPGDVVIDGGNSWFEETDRHAAALAQKGIAFIGMGVSGGEEGARRGPSMMPGGAAEGYPRVREMLEAAAARVDDEPCIAWLGPGSAGHYVKMVHNGIEYGLMQLIAESYDLLKRGLGLDNARLAKVYGAWDRGELASFLVGITAEIFTRPDEEGGGELVDHILDAARQKGTGMWTSRDALELQVPVPVIDTAVMMRDLSALKSEREAAAQRLQGPAQVDVGSVEELLPVLERALHAAFILTYAQGMSLLQHASQQRGYNLDLAAVARIWRGGCIIRSALLEPMRAAFSASPALPSLLLDTELGGRVAARQGDLRRIVTTAVALGVPVPALMAALAYFDAWRSARLPANLIQAQRDYFGAHTYERTDAEGTFHTHWQEGGRHER